MCGKWLTGLLNFHLNTLTSFAVISDVLHSLTSVQPRRENNYQGLPTRSSPFKCIPNSMTDRLRGFEQSFMRWVPLTILKSNTELCRPAAHTKGPHPILILGQCQCVQLKQCTWWLLNKQCCLLLKELSGTNCPRNIHTTQNYVNSVLNITLNYILMENETHICSAWRTSIIDVT